MSDSSNDIVITGPTVPTLEVVVLGERGATGPPPALPSGPNGDVIVLDDTQPSGLNVTEAAPLAMTAQMPSQVPLPAANTADLGVGDYAMRGDAIISACPTYVTINNQTGTTYAPALVDINALVTLSNASAITVTIPANASVAFPIGSVIEFMWLGAGQPTFAITSDTLRATPGTKLRTQYSRASLIKIAATVWSLAGDLSA